MYNNDPELQYVNNVYSAVQNNCHYFVEDTFINKCSRLSAMNKTFSLLDTKIRSISKHLHELYQYLHVINHNFFLLVLGKHGVKITMSTVVIYQVTKHNIFIGTLK